MDRQVLDPIFIMKSVSPVQSLLFLQASLKDYLLAGTEDGTVSFWHLKSQRLNNKLALCAGSSACVGMHYINQCLITQDRMGLVKIWSEQEGKFIQNIQMQLTHCGMCKIDGSDVFGGVVACPQNQLNVEVYHINSGKKIISFIPKMTDGHILGEIMICKFIHMLGNVYLLAAYESGMLLLWDFKTKHFISKQMFSNTPLALDFDELQCQGICGSSSNKMQVFGLDSGHNLSIVHKIKLPNAGVGCVKIKSDTNLAVVGGWDGRLRKFSWNPFHPSAVIAVHSKGIQDICFSERNCAGLDEGSVMAVGSSDCRISLWDM